MTANTKIKLRRSDVGDKVPTTTDLDLGELAVNTYDGKIFLKRTVDDSSDIVTISNDYNDLVNVPQALSPTSSPTFNNTTLDGRLNFTRPVRDNNASIWYAYASTTDSATNQIIVDDATGFNEGDPILFNFYFSRTKNNFGNIKAYKIFYIKSIVDETTITISETVDGSEFVLYDDEAGDVFVTINGMTVGSYQLQRAPRQFTRYDSLLTTGYDKSSITFGDTFYDDVNQRIFIFVDLGDGSPQAVDITTL